VNEISAQKRALCVKRSTTGTTTKTRWTTTTAKTNVRRRTTTTTKFPKLSHTAAWWRTDPKQTSLSWLWELFYITYYIPCPFLKGLNGPETTKSMSKSLPYGLAKNMPKYIGWTISSLSQKDITAARKRGAQTIQSLNYSKKNTGCSFVLNSTMPHVARSRWPCNYFELRRYIYQFRNFDSVSIILPLSQHRRGRHAPPEYARLARWVRVHDPPTFAMTMSLPSMHNAIPGFGSLIDGCSTGV